ncbi:MAG: transposase, partial [Holophagales bacterium]|nr:transposase [Holophagales bacterium]
IVTAGPVADCTQAGGLVEGIEAENLIADKGYDTDAVVAMSVEAGMAPVIPPRSNRKERRRYDEYLYRLRHLVENAFAEMKRWRGIATRYAKNAASYLATVHIRCIIMWAKIY